MISDQDPSAGLRVCHEPCAGGMPEQRKASSSSALSVTPRSAAYRLAYSRSGAGREIEVLIKGTIADGSVRLHIGLIVTSAFSNP